MFAEPIAHVDMDAFFVEVERLRRPELVGRPVVVGGTGPRGVVASASYEARRRGVSSAMPMVHATRLCPGAVVVPPDHTEYRRASREVFAVLESFTPHVEPLSVDEAFLDISGLRLHYDDPASVGEAIRSEIANTTGLPSSVGIATSKFIAKLASREAKPAGLKVVPSGTETAFLHPMPVRALWGVGEATYARLEELGIVTVEDLAAFPRDALERRLGSSLGVHLADLANAHDPRSVTGAGSAQSISVEATYDTDLTDPDEVDRALLRHADRLARRLRTAGYAARTIQLKLRRSDFSTVTRRQTLAAPIDNAHALLDVARELLTRAGGTQAPIRLLGLGGDGLVPSGDPRQLDLVEDRWDDVEQAVDDVRTRFGGDAVERARLVDPPPSGDPRPGPKGSRR